MGILASSVSITQYLVDGSLVEPIIETVYNGLKKHAIEEIDNDPSDKAIGWSSFNDPFAAQIDPSSFLVGSHFVFSMRIDKKTIPAKVIQKHYTREMNKRLAANDREFLSKTEKKEIKDQVIQMLSMRIPATPNLYDIIWDYEAAKLWFFSNLKGANEELETLFTRSFSLKLIRLFPYTMVALTSHLSDAEKDVMTMLPATRFTK